MEDISLYNGLFTVVFTLLVGTVDVIFITIGATRVLHKWYPLGGSTSESWMSTRNTSICRTASRPGTPQVHTLSSGTPLIAVHRVLQVPEH